VEKSLQQLHQVYLSLGSNLGDRKHNLLQAIRLIGERVGDVTRQSSFISTEPWGFQSDHLFLNAVILCETLLTPREVLVETQRIEKTLGKQRRHATRRNTSVQTATDENTASQDVVYSDRPIDIDILLYDDLTVNEPDLQIPHPLMTERDFVMIPLNEILTPNKQK